MDRPILIPKRQDELYAHNRTFKTDIASPERLAYAYPSNIIRPVVIKGTERGCDAKTVIADQPYYLSSFGTLSERQPIHSQSLHSVQEVIDSTRF